MWLQGLFLCFVIELHGISYGQFSGTNIALNKPANQSPGTYCAIIYNLVCYNASKAVDGMLEETGDLIKGYCSLTQEQYETAASWSVDFGASYYINGIRVHNRKPVATEPPIGSRLRNFNLYGTTPEHRNGSLLYTYDYVFTGNDYPLCVNITLPENSYYSGIKIEIPYRGKNESTVLTLCEVEVYSVLCEQLNNDFARVVKLSDNLNNGSQATFTCKSGYYLSHNYSLLCKDGNWSREPPKCLEVFCQIPSIQNGHYKPTDGCSTNSKNESLPFNCTVEPRCDKGYYLIDGEKMVCTESGEWSTSGPVCQRATCSLPKDTFGKYYVYTNGSEITGDTVYYGTNITVQCKLGFKLSGEKEKITCLENNSLIGQSQECIPVTCEHPGNDSIINGSFQDVAGNAYTEGQKNYSEYINIRCVEGYTSASSSNVITCREDGNWDNLPVVCVAIRCAVLEETLEFTYEYSDRDTDKTLPYNSTVRISCVNEPETTQVRICSQAGHWNGNSPVCGTLVNTVAVIGGAVAGGVVLLLIIVVLLILLKRR